jgi:hypothetical protein
MSTIKGYTPLSPEISLAMNQCKEMEERCKRLFEILGNDPALNVDGRNQALAVTALETAFMRMNRALAKPQRIELEGDAAAFDHQDL